MFKHINKQIKKLNWLDLKMVGIYGIALGLLAATIWKDLTMISVWWYIIIAVISGGYFCFRLFRK